VSCGKNEHDMRIITVVSCNVSPHERLSIFLSGKLFLGDQLLAEIKRHHRCVWTKLQKEKDAAVRSLQ
jgi:hypothetical protein